MNAFRSHGVIIKIIIFFIKKKKPGLGFNAQRPNELDTVPRHNSSSPLIFLHFVLLQLGTELRYYLLETIRYKAGTMV